MYTEDCGNCDGHLAGFWTNLFRTGGEIAATAIHRRVAEPYRFPPTYTPPYVPPTVPVYQQGPPSVSLEPETNWLPWIAAGVGLYLIARR